MKEVLARRTLKPPFSFKKAWDRDENLSDFIPTMEYMEENLCEEGDNGSFSKWWQRWTVTTALNVVQSRVRACGVGTYFQFWEIGLFTLLKNGKPEGVFFFFFKRYIYNQARVTKALDQAQPKFKSDWKKWTQAQSQLHKREPKSAQTFSWIRVKSVSPPKLQPYPS